MKRLFRKTKKLIKGTSTAVLISAAFHIILLILASGWVVFTVIEKHQQKFVPVQVNRPKMDLKKLRVKVKESAKPRKSSERIVSARRSNSMSDLQLPKMTGTGMGEGLSKGIGGFDMMADLSKMTLMGSSRSVGNDLIGTCYDLSRFNNGSSSGIQPSEAIGDCQPVNNIIRDFLSNNWDQKYLTPYFRAPIQLHATQFVIPAIQSVDAPALFGIREEDVTWPGSLWIVYYKGKFASKTGGTFRFRGAADEWAYVRVNGKVVWQASWSDGFTDIINPHNWKSSSPDNKKYGLANITARVGDWFTLEPGGSAEIGVLFGEVGGGYSSFVLLVEEKDKEYPKNREGGPILPVFKMMETPASLIDEINFRSIPDDFTLEGGPIFNVY